jgi:hypothetical protein
MISTNTEVNRTYPSPSETIPCFQHNDTQHGVTLSVTYFCSYVECCNAQ